MNINDQVKVNKNTFPKGDPRQVFEGKEGTIVYKYKNKCVVEFKPGLDFRVSKSHLNPVN